MLPVFNFHDKYTMERRCYNIEKTAETDEFRIILQSINVFTRAQSPAFRLNGGICHVFHMGNMRLILR